jgi:hypothetical protein
VIIHATVNFGGSNPVIVTGTPQIQIVDGTRPPSNIVWEGINTNNVWVRQGAIPDTIEIMIALPFITTSAVTDVPIGDIKVSYTLTEKRAVSTFTPPFGSPDLGWSMDINNHSVTGCYASTQPKVRLAGFDDEVALNFNYRGTGSFDGAMGGWKPSPAIMPEIDSEMLQQLINATASN